MDIVVPSYKNENTLKYTARKEKGKRKNLTKIPLHLFISPSVMVKKEFQNVKFLSKIGCNNNSKS